MLDAIIRLSLRHRALVVALAVGVLVYGGYLATTFPIDVFPDLDRPRVVLLMECPGLAPEEVETLVTQPLENQLLGATGVQAVRSQSTLGLAVVYVEFDWATELRQARQVVQERLAGLTDTLPEGIRPHMLPPASIMGQIMLVGLSRRPGPTGGLLVPIPGTAWWLEIVGDDSRATVQAWSSGNRRAIQHWEPVAVDHWTWHATPSSKAHTAKRIDVTIRGQVYEVSLPAPLEQKMALRETADWVIRPQVLKIPGVAEVLVLGGERRQYQVLVDPDALVEFELTLHDVENALRESNLTASGGFAADGAAERPIRFLGRLGATGQDVLEELKLIPVKSAGRRPVMLRQVAQVTLGPEPKRGEGGVDGQAGVVLTIVKQPHADTRRLTERIKAVLQELEQRLPDDLRLNTDLFQLKGFIDRGLYYVGEALILGASLVIIVLFIFLINFRTTFITLTAIPLSLAVTAVVFKLVGVVTGHALSINVMTLGGLAVAMGELVDDAIVDVENIFRRLQEHRARGGTSAEFTSTLRVVYEASREIRGAIVYGTAVVILVFLPLFALSGVEGRLFTPLGIAYIVSILASLLVSLTVTPVLSSYLLPKSKAVQREHDGFVLRLLKWLAAPLVRFSMRHAGVLLVATWTCVGLCVWQLTRLGTDFLPPFDEGSIQINVGLPPGSSLQASNEVAAIIDRHLVSLMKTPTHPEGEILHFVRRTGRAELDEHAEPVSRSEYVLSMNPHTGRTRSELIRRVLDPLRDQLPGVDLDAEQPLAHLISHMLSGVSAQIAIKIFGDDLGTLHRLARQVKGEISGVPGLAPPIIEPQVQVDEVHIIPRPEGLAHLGLTRQHLADLVRTALQGSVVSQIHDGPRRFDLVVRLPDALRTDWARLKSLRIDVPNRPNGVPLGEIANISDSAAGPNQIMRENARRRIVIRCNVQGRDLGSAVAELEQRIRTQVVLPHGFTIEFGGQFESQRAATWLIALLASTSLIGVFFVLLMLKPSVRVALQILNAVPTAFVGGVVALTLTGQSVTVASLVGFVSLGGIAVRNGILLVTHYFHLMKAEGETFTQQMILRGSLERLSPVLMTALTAGIALVPIVVGGQKPGLEILYPVATVILGGLVTSTFCEFLIHPGLFWRFSGKDVDRLLQRESFDELS
jgi:HME family heavy-metal exporter